MPIAGSVLQEESSDDTRLEAAPAPQAKPQLDLADGPCDLVLCLHCHLEAFGTMHGHQPHQRLLSSLIDSQK